jgi:hypothetical protein
MSELCLPAQALSRTIPYPLKHMLPSPRRRPRLSDWGIGMTICIAAICNWDGKEDAIVSASDHMLSLGGTSTADNMALKAEPIHRDWEIMFSGEDVSRVDLVFERIQQEMIQKTHCGLSEVSEIVACAYNDARRQMIENTILRPLSMTMEDFMDVGLKKMGSANYSNILYEIRNVSLGFDLLISGFDGSGSPHIFTVSGDGDVRVSDRVGCWAIGSGSQNALASLFFHPYSRLFGVNRAIYQVCEAKFMAEKAVGVGRITLMSVRRFGQTDKSVYEHNIDVIRESWDAYGKPRIPRGILQQIDSMIED